jgi:hypothetical protein
MMQVIVSQPSLPGLTRQSISLRKEMDARIKSAHDGAPFERGQTK